MASCERCKGKGTVILKTGERVCYEHYNQAVREGRAEGARVR